MKKTNQILNLVILTAFFISSCNNLKIVKGNGNIISTNRHLTNYNAIKVCCGIDVIITQDSLESVRVETDENLQSYIKTELKGQELTIFTDNGSISSKTIKVHVGVKKLTAVDASSGSSVETINQVTLDSLQLEASSGADIKMNVHTKYVSCHASSGSDMVVKGETISLLVDASSGASIKNQDLKAETCKANASSGSTVKVNVSDKIKADASSGSDIIISGNPKTKTENKASGGTIKFE